jgi:hypothetical protein
MKIAPARFTLANCPHGLAHDSHTGHI